MIEQERIDTAETSQLARLFQEDMRGQWEERRLDGYQGRLQQLH